MRDPRTEPRVGDVLEIRKGVQWTVRRVTRDETVCFDETDTPYECEMTIGQWKAYTSRAKVLQHAQIIKQAKEGT